MNSPSFSFWNSQTLPVILQDEAAECGLACLAMVSSYWGHSIDLASMRRRFTVSLKGATLKGIISVARALSLQTRPLKLDLEHLPDLKLPCILHWDMNHFVVLKSVYVGGAIIHDPTVGLRKISKEQFTDHFTGVALELSPSATFSRGNDTQRFTLFSLMGRVVGYKRSVIQLLILGVALQVCLLVVPFYMQWIVDEALVASDKDLITVLGIGFLLLVVVQATISAVRSWITTVLSTNLNFQWFGNAFTHLMKLPLTYFESRHLGDIVSRFGSIQQIQKIITNQFVESIVDGLLVIFTLIIMLLYSPQLAAVAMAAVAGYAVLRWSMFRPLIAATSEQIIHSAKQQTHFLESARGVQSVRLFGRTDERRVGWMNALADQFNADLRISRLSVTHQTANTFVFSAERVLVIWLAALAVLDNRFSVGMLFAFVSYKDQFSQRTAALIDKVFEFRMLRLHGERVADILLSSAEEDNSSLERHQSDQGPVAPTIRLSGVSFKYSDEEPYVIKDLNLEIGAGQCVAITGGSGCGKTTLVKILLGLVEPTEGSVDFAGINIKNIGLANYRSMIGTVMQNDQLFTGSIADNICFFDPAPNQQNIQVCAQLAAIHDEISLMPMGYNTLIGDIGSGLSGGQVQRVLLARALYKRPKILVLDEATSHLDLSNESLVNSAISQIPLTRVIVAHRPETIAMAQRVIVLEKGAIAHDVLQSNTGPRMSDSAQCEPETTLQR